jgi:hypothetical protein
MPDGDRNGDATIRSTGHWESLLPGPNDFRDMRSRVFGDVPSVENLIICSAVCAYGRVAAYVIQK